MPVNHHLRPLYRALAMLSGLYLIIFGVIGLGKTSDQDLWSTEGLTRVLGQHSNRGLALISIVVGAVVLLAALAGRNIDRIINYWVSVGMFLFGTLMLGLIRFENIFGASVSTVIVWYVLGLILFGAAMYGKTGTAEQAQAEEEFRHAAR
jgi:hypothetical protein